MSLARLQVPARGIVAQCDGMSQSALQMLNAGDSAEAYLGRLCEAQQTDALLFLAHCLPQRLAIWWGCHCFWCLAGDDLDPESELVLGHIVQWIMCPSESLRRECQLHADQLTTAHPLGVLALAVYVSVGSLAPAGLPAVPPARELTAKTVHVAQMLLAAQGDPSAHYREFLHLGHEIAQGRNLWI